MSVVVIGLNHRTAPLDLLERVSIDDDRLPKALQDLAGREHVSEAVVLSTCNRIEVYAVTEGFHGAFRDIRDFLGEQAFLAPEDFADHLYVQHGESAVDRLFSVAAGLDSAVIGENEILRQVRHAWDRAREEGAAGPLLNMLFRHALEVGKRARSETGIACKIASVSSAAVAMAEEHLGVLGGRRVVVLGAGEMGEGMVRSLAGRGVADIAIANRTWDHALDLARRVGGRAIRLPDVDAALGDADLLLSSTGASSIIVEHSDLEQVVGRRPAGRPLLIIDVAVPRDVDPTAGELDGITLLDMDDLRAFAEIGMAERRCEVGAVRRIVDEALDRYMSEATARDVAPLVSELHRRADAIRAGELDRFRARLGPLDDAQREGVDALTHAIVAKLLHEPTISLKDAAGTPRGERLAGAMSELFGL